MSKGGSTKSGGYSTSTTTLPSWLDTASQQAVSEAQALQGTGWNTPYSGQWVAGQDPATLQAYQAVQNLQGGTTPAYNAATGAWGGVLGNLQSLTPNQIQAMTNQLYGGYAGNVVAPSAGLLAPYMGQGPATAGQVGANAMTLMSPYEQAVVNPTLALGGQQLAQNLQTIGAGANQANAFGGTRQGVMEGIAQSQAALGTEQYVGNLLSQGYNAAMTPAYNLASLGAQQGYGAAGQLATQLQAGYQPAATQAGNIATTNLGLGTSAAQQLPQLAANQQTALGQQASMLQSIGQQQQQYQQALINAAMQKYTATQEMPIEDLSLLTGALSGVPYGSTTTGYSTGTGGSTASGMSSAASGIGAAGSLLGGLGATGAFGGAGWLTGAAGLLAGF